MTNPAFRHHSVWQSISTILCETVLPTVAQKRRVHFHCLASVEPFCTSHLAKLDMTQGTYAQAIAGKPLHMEYDCSKRTFTLDFVATVKAGVEHGKPTLHLFRVWMRRLRYLVLLPFQKCIFFFAVVLKLSIHEPLTCLPGRTHWDLSQRGFQPRLDVRVACDISMTVWKCMKRCRLSCHSHSMSMYIRPYHTHTDAHCTQELHYPTGYGFSASPPGCLSVSHPTRADTSPLHVVSKCRLPPVFYRERYVKNDATISTSCLLAKDA